MREVGHGIANGDDRVTVLLPAGLLSAGGGLEAGSAGQAKALTGADSYSHITPSLSASRDQP
ncbi:hypothetical protein Kisp01_65890 [Kineosporia sp. NBRC 101677]|nr:hypothetical protein Kisp01_65890 [Kineosporia sp. NBRC 101677]